MKKISLMFISLFLVACSSQQTTKPITESIITPNQVKNGFLKISPDGQYYADINSVWSESAHNKLIYFDTVINLSKGPHLYPQPFKYAKSIRQAKRLNCENYRLDQLNTTYYSEFWGEGDPFIPKQQRKYQVKLRAESSLATLAQVLCTNLYKY
ncbi:surface-adhesin protein E [Mesocricetibacter intestinalis]|uniref:Surface-adhesin protein n=1 Tax=Mesocricetibacter intestinalis TaxID=1521930 RepID=A0A4R6VCJ0_9PAST|nr:surface-adhesin E family protein [Mesocricetibacter intestinalis]TDQ58146.1 surface-adhesin protein E [Mesocricetibacter intestinalis]